MFKKKTSLEIGASFAGFAIATTSPFPLNNNQPLVVDLELKSS